MILLSNICIIVIVLVCLLWISSYIVARHSISKKATPMEIIAASFLFLLLTGAIMPRLYIWLF